MRLEDILMLDHYEYLTVAVDFVLFVVIMTVIGKVVGMVANVSSIHELSENDNASFGVSFAGALLAVAIMMTGAVSGEATISLVYEAGIVSAYGLLGITLMMLTRYLFDRWALPHIAIREHILAGNLAAAIIDAGNMIATAVVIRAVMIWVDSESYSGLSIVLAGFLFSQLVMIAVTRYRQYVYRRRHQGQLLQEAFANGNVAVALRYFGHRVGAGLAITAASGIARYNDGQAYFSALVWALVSIHLTVVKIHTHVERLRLDCTCSCGACVDCKDHGHLEDWFFPHIFCVPRVGVRLPIRGCLNYGTGEPLAGKRGCIE